MATKEKNLGLVTEHSKQLETLRGERQALTREIYEELDTTEQRFGELNTDTIDDQAGEAATKLEQGLAQYGGYKQTIADLAEGLTGSLTEYVQFASEGQNYQGLEWVASFVWKKKANQMRIARLKTQSPRDNLQQILDFGEQLFQEICEVREGAVETYQKLQANGDVITAKIAEYEPQESELKEKLDAMEAEFKEVDDRYATATASEQAKLVGQRNEMSKAMTDIRNHYDQVFTVYSQAQQALEANRQSRDAFEQMVRDLGRQATMIKEKIDNVTEIYMAAPEAVKVMMTTKGMESLDQAVNVTTDKSVDLITRAAQSVQDATQAREEIQLIDEQVMRGFMERMAATKKDFDERYNGIRRNAQRSQNERYGD